MTGAVMHWVEDRKLIGKNFGPIAQVVEHPADNGEVSRSSRLGPTKSYKLPFYGDVAQLVEHPLCKRRVSGSNPLISTKKLS